MTGTGIAADTKVKAVDTVTGVVELTKSITADLVAETVTFKTDTIRLNVDALATGISVNDVVTSAVTGVLPAGTTVTAINGAKVTLSNDLTGGGVVQSAVVTFESNNGALVFTGLYKSATLNKVGW